MSPKKWPPPEERFWSQVDKDGPLILKSKCWLFIGHANQWGYTQMMINKKNVYVHRFSYAIHKGDIPRGRVVMHRCDNTRCVNPSHLKLGTPKANTRDCIKKGRFKGFLPGWNKTEKIKQLPDETPPDGGVE